MDSFGVIRNTCRSKDLEESEKALKLEAMMDYNKLLKMEETSWRQKSRICWLREGDRNIHFFHRMANLRSSINMICKLKVNKEWVTEDAEIRNRIEDYYKNLFYDPLQIRPNIEGIKYHLISLYQQRWLERPLLEDEVMVALKILVGDKAPGLDGFSIKILKGC